MPFVEQLITETWQDDPNFAAYVITELFGVPLYAYYVVVIDRYQDGEIEGTLMTQPFEFLGPFTSFEDACKMLADL